MTDAIPNDKVTGGEAVGRKVVVETIIEPNHIRFPTGIGVDLDMSDLDEAITKAELPEGPARITIEPIDTPSPEPLPESGAGNGKDYGRASEAVSDDAGARVAARLVEIENAYMEAGDEPDVVCDRQWRFHTDIVNLIHDLDPDAWSKLAATRANPDEGNATGTPDVGAAEVDKNTCTKALCANCDAGKTISLPPDSVGVVIRESCPNCTEEPNDGAAGRYWASGVIVRDRENGNGQVCECADPTATAKVAAARNYLSEGSAG